MTKELINGLKNKNYKIWLKSAFLMFLLFAFYFLFPVACFAAVLYFNPEFYTLYEEDSFVVEIKLDSEGQQVNAAQATLVFSDKLEFVDYSEGNSIFSLWPQKPVLNNNEISFIGGVPKGFKGDKMILKIIFKSKEISEESEAKISFKKDSRVFLNDGEGTEAEISFSEALYKIIKKPEKLPYVTSETHPEQDKWYGKNTLRLTWDFNEDSFYRYALDEDNSVLADNFSEKTGAELIKKGYLEYSDLNDGIYYFHVMEGRKDSNGKEIFGPEAVFKAMIDTIPPEDFKAEIGRDSSVFEGKYFLSFFAEDSGSGIDHYEVFEKIKEEQGLWKTGNSPYLFEDQDLKNIIKVKAVDKASNERIIEVIPPEKITEAEEIKVFTYWYIILIPFIILIILWIVISLRKRKKDNLKK